MRLYRFFSLLVSGALFALLAGCAALAPLVPQTYALRTEWPQGVPHRVELTDVPFYPQLDYQCGPAALATVLNHTRAVVSAEALIDQVWLPSRKGSLQVEMLAAPRQHGRVSYRLSTSYADLLREVAAGNPVIVLQDVGPLFTQWHYAVVNGFDYESGTIYLRSGTEPRKAMSFTAFERSWLKGAYWAMVVLPPGRIAATANEERWTQSVLAFERAAGAADAREAYKAALRQWPASLPLAIGLANQHHVAGAYGEAVSVLQGALARHPESVIAMNNLAQNLSDQGRHREALAQIDRAMDPQSPFASEVRATRQMILDRLAQRR